MNPSRAPRVGFSPTSGPCATSLSQSHDPMPWPSSRSLPLGPCAPVMALSQLQVPLPHPCPGPCHQPLCPSQLQVLVLAPRPHAVAQLQVPPAAMALPGSTSHCHGHVPMPPLCPSSMSPSHVPRAQSCASMWLLGWGGGVIWGHSGQSQPVSACRALSCVPTSVPSPASPNYLHDPIGCPPSPGPGEMWGTPGWERLLAGAMGAAGAPRAAPWAPTPA